MKLVLFSIIIVYQYLLYVHVYQFLNQFHTPIH